MDNKKMHWLTLALMAFVPLWGFTNTILGFYYFNGVGAIIPWLLVFILFFLPYTLMVGELGSVFYRSDGGVSSWINQTFGKRLAFFAGWTYWVVHMPYLAQKPTRILVAFNWLFYGNGDIVSSLSPLIVQSVALVIFIIAIFLTLRGLSFLKKISSVCGIGLFILSMLYILMMFVAPAINKDVSFNSIDWTSSKLWLSGLNSKTVFNLSILVLAVGGCEKLAPYVNQLEKPSKNFPKVMITVTIMVVICALLGTIALAMMYPTGVPNSFLTSGAYDAFEKLGNYFGIGKFFVYVYGLIDALINLTVIIVSVDAPLRVLLSSSDKEYIPSWLFGTNKKGVYRNGIILVTIIVSIIIILPAFGIGNMDAIVKYVIDLNSICMPLRYLWVFLAYIALKKASDKFASGDGYKLTQSKGFGMAIGAWCFIITAYACISKMFNVEYGTSEGIFKLCMNLLTPLILLAFGFILPAIAKRTNKDVFVNGKYNPELDKYNKKIESLKNDATI